MRAGKSLGLVGRTERRAYDSYVDKRSGAGSRGLFDGIGEQEDGDREQQAGQDAEERGEDLTYGEKGRCTEEIHHQADDAPNHGRHRAERSGARHAEASEEVYSTNVDESNDGESDAEERGDRRGGQIQDLEKKCVVHDAPRGVSVSLTDANMTPP